MKIKVGDTVTINEGKLYKDTDGVVINIHIACLQSYTVEHYDGTIWWYREQALELTKNMYNKEPFTPEKQDICKDICRCNLMMYGCKCEFGQAELEKERAR